MSAVNCFSTVANFTGQKGNENPLPAGRHPTTIVVQELAPQHRGEIRVATINIIGARYLVDPRISVGGCLLGAVYMSSFFKGC